jgi:hypothetical protein
MNVKQIATIWDIIWLLLKMAQCVSVKLV